MSHRVVDVEQIEPAGPGGAVRFVRRELGTRAFGINQFILEPGFEGPAHDEGTTGQGEGNIVVGGGGRARSPPRRRPGRGRSTSSWGGVARCALTTPRWRCRSCGSCMWIRGP